MFGPHTSDLFSVASNHLAEAGHQVRAIDAGRIGKLMEEIDLRREAGELDETLYSEYQDHFGGGAQQKPVGARSIMVVATPQPMLRLTFMRNGTRNAVIVPPIYSNGTDRRVLDLLTAALGPYGHRIERACLPKKLLAVRSGLAEYGRNNIAYVEGMGSFFRLTAFYTDAALIETEWREPRMTAACERCSVCSAHCPTGAIASDRFLIHAERCLTFHNERVVPFPDWIDPAWHHCLIGCMHCQTACPLNKTYVHWIEDSEVFSEEETAWLLNEGGAAGSGDSVKEKLRRINMLDDFEKFPRNLKAIID